MNTSVELNIAAKLCEFQKKCNYGTFLMIFGERRATTILRNYNETACNVLRWYSKLSTADKTLFLSKLSYPDLYKYKIKQAVLYKDNGAKTYRQVEYRLMFKGKIVRKLNWK